jgi:5-methylcytosine-specific restriction protein A
MPIKPRHPCSYPGCPELTYERYCPKHRRSIDQAYNLYQRDKTTKKYYGRSWELVRTVYINEHPFCEQCLKGGKFTKTEEVHHKIPLSKGGTHDMRNLMSLCKSCHSRISVETGDRWHDRKRG